MNIFISCFGHSCNSINLLFFSSLLKDPNLKQTPNHNGSNQTIFFMTENVHFKMRKVNILLTQNNSNTFPMWNMIARGFFMLACSILSNF